MVIQESMILAKTRYYFVLLCLLLLSCQQNDNKADFLDKEYVGLWASTEWSYSFKKDGRFTFTSSGHYGNVAEEGKYAVIDDMILLNPDSDWHSLQGVLKPRLKLISSGCLRDYDGNYYCTDTDSTNYYIEQKYEFEEQVEGLLDKLPEVAHERKRLSYYMAKDSSLEEPFIGFDKMLIVNNEEYYVFSLFQWNDKETYSYLDFLVKKNPFEIYQHYSSGDSLALVYKNNKLPPTTE